MMDLESVYLPPPPTPQDLELMGILQDKNL
jgi:hypothetical protein